MGWMFLTAREYLYCGAPRRVGEEGTRALTVCVPMLAATRKEEIVKHYPTQPRGSQPPSTPTTAGPASGPRGTHPLSVPGGAHEALGWTPVSWC